MDVRLALAGVLIAGYVAYKGVERAGGKLPFTLGAPRGRGRALAARKPPSPDKLTFERVTLDATPATLQSFIRLTGHLERLGFWIVADYAIAGWPDLYCRGLVHPDKPVHAVIVERQGLPAHVELFTLFDDLSALVTSGSEEADDPGKPASLRFQQIPGLSVDELYVQHLSSLDNLFQDQLNPMPATRLGFFEHQRALLVIEHELAKAKRALRTENLSRKLDTLPDLPTRDLLKRYGLEEPEVEAAEPEAPKVASRSVPAQPVADATSEPEDAPKRWGIGSSLLSKRIAAREEVETPVTETVATVQTLIREPEANALPLETVVLAVSVEEAPPIVELPPYEAAAEVPTDEVGAMEPRSSLPFEEAPEAIVPVRLPWELEPEPTEGPLVEEASVDSAAPAAEPTTLLPFEIVPEEPVVSVPAALSLPFEVTSEAEPTTSSKPTCPHCGATLFSSLSSRCSKCKQAVR